MILTTRNPLKSLAKFEVAVGVIPLLCYTLSELAYGRQKICRGVEPRDFAVSVSSTESPHCCTDPFVASFEGAYRPLPFGGLRDSLMQTKYYYAANEFGFGMEMADSRSAFSTSCTVMSYSSSAVGSIRI